MTNDEALPEVRQLRLTPASHFKPKRVRWLMPDRIPLGEVSLTAGRAGIGKSTFLAHLAGAVTRGDLGGDLKRPAGVAIVATEDSWEYTIVPRLMAAGADLERVFRLDVTEAEIGGYTLSLPADDRRLEAAIRDNDLGAVILDPLLSALHGKLDAHRDQDVRQALTPLTRIANATGAAIVGNAHLRKAVTGDLLSMVSGSLAFGAVARAVLGFAADPDSGEHVMSLIKSNLGPGDVPDMAYRLASVNVPTDDGDAPVARFEIAGEATTRMRDMINGGDDDRSERDAAVEWLRDYLIDAGGGAPAADVKRDCSRAGFAVRTIERARVKAGVTTNRQGFGKGATYVWEYDPGSSSPHGDHDRQDIRAGEHGEHRGGW
ncbi:AAA family ATPase [Demequina flava]|uniref:AAA family ATPase n=1 Tax=Demequina flava TaxID=1095025 RepID=UPI0007866B4A|nr:AAA family ATPase [Demequina flava]